MVFPFLGRVLRLLCTDVLDGSVPRLPYILIDYKCDIVLSLQQSSLRFGAETFVFSEAGKSFLKKPEKELFHLRKINRMSNFPVPEGSGTSWDKGRDVFC